MIDQSAADGGSVVASGQQTNILTVEVKSESSEILLGSMISAIEEHMGYFVQLNTKCAVWITQTPKQRRDEHSKINKWRGQVATYISIPNLHRYLEL